MLKKLYFFPQKNLVASIPLVLILGFIIGSQFDIFLPQPTIMLATMIMIYATMIGFNIKEIFTLTQKRILGYSALINFIFIPLLAYIIGITFLKSEPIMFAGLALAALLPTSGMTISWTGISKGNLSAAVKLTVIGLIAGSLLTPFYLNAMVGQYVQINVLQTFRMIIMIVFVPMILGHFTFKALLKKYSAKQFKKDIKPNLQPLSIWAMLFIVFTSVSMRAQMIIDNLYLIAIALAILIVFYLINFLVSTIIAKKAFNREDGIALVYGTVLRNLSIAIGLAATAFGAEAALLVTLAFIVQQQGVVIYNKFAQKYWFKEVAQEKQWNVTG